MDQNVSSEGGVETILMEQNATSAQKIRQVTKWGGEHLHHRGYNQPASTFLPYLFIFVK